MTTLEISKMTSSIGAEVSGVDLREPLDGPLLDEIRRALLSHLVLVFRAQFLDPDQHVAFARQFGEMHYSAVPTAHGGPPEINVLDMVKPKGNGSDRWHSDSPFLTEPTDATFLNAVMMPPTGGDTCFANMYDAYDNLSEPMKRYLDGLYAVQDVTTTLYLAVDKGNSDFDVAEMQRRLPPVEHPIVRTHPETGRKVLYVDAASTSKIVGVSRKESELILDHLFSQAHNAAVQCRVRWQAGDLVFYDNRCTQHVAVPDYTERRIMHLVSIKGSRPV
ncbi:MAG: TauD/TfdA family dioxygenase [Acidimicrobiales bacterium]